MNKNAYIILLIMATHVINCSSKNSFHQTIKSFLRSNTIEKNEQREFSVASIHSLSLNNCNGSITVKTGPKKSLFLRTIKRAKTEIIANNIDVITDITNGNHLAITTKNNNKKKNGLVDYELIVPASLNITLTITGKGNVFIKDVHGMIDVVAHDDITIINTKQRASAQSLNKGSINFANTGGPVEAYTRNGNIIGDNIAHSCDARSIKGSINISYKKLPATGSINLKTTSGNIMLALPTDTNAQICGYTTYGTFISDHEIRLKSYATKLNKTAWNKFKKEVDGTLGTGDATIMVQSTKGSVKIIETQTT